MAYLKKYFLKVQEDKRHLAVISYLAALDHLHGVYPEIAKAIVQELKDQRENLKLIASENFSSLAVQLAMGNLLTDKYSEGYPHKRFYAGCENVDTVESCAIEQVKQLFAADHAYVQPHSGADANLVAFWAILTQRVQNKEIERLSKKSIDELSAEEHEAVRKLMLSQKMMGMSLSSGGHLTHGYRHNVSSKIFQSVPYDVDKDTGLIDYAALKEKVKQEKPAVLIAGYSSYPRKINFAIMREIADLVGATLLVDMAHFAGLVAGKVFTGDENPIPFAHIVTSTTHKTLRGPRGGLVLCTKEYKEVVDRGCPIILGGPLPHVMAAKAIAFKEANSEEFTTYAHQIVKNAQALAGALKKRGCTITTGGTDNHLLVIDVGKSFQLTGRQAELALREAHLTVNRNAIPFDQNGAWYTSGVRLGTAALTTLGMKESQMEKIAEMVVTLLTHTKAAYVENKVSKAQVEIEPKVLEGVKTEVKQLLARFPLYPEIIIE